jgi:hypothetical protein
VYVSAKVPRAFIIYAGGDRVETCLRTDYFTHFELQLNDPATVFICDGIELLDVAAFSVLITSPNLDLWKLFDDLDSSRRLFFPVFARCEIADMQPSCFPHLAARLGDGRVWARFDSVGGVPRFVFNRLNDDLRAYLKNGISRILIERLDDFIGEATIESDSIVSQRVIHIKVAGEVAAAVREPVDASMPHVAFEGARDPASYVPVRTEFASALAAELVVAASETRRRYRSARL